MSDIQHKITKHANRQETPQTEETKQASKPESDMVQILELPGRKFKISTINMLNILIEK